MRARHASRQLRAAAGAAVSAVLIAGAVAVLAAAQAVVLDGPALLRDMQLLAADDMEGRATGTPGAARARALLVDRFRSVGLEPLGDTFEDPFAFDDTSRGINLVGRITGTRDPDRFIVVSAHYDHVGVRDGRVFNGANDNASGAAALAHIAAHFTRHRPATSILIVAFDAEERGLRGSRAFVAAPPVDRAALLFNLNLDMIGRDPADALWVSGTHQFPALRPIVARVAADAPVNLRMGYDDPAAGRRNDWTRDSDQWAFIEAGIPALYVGTEDYAFHHDDRDEYESMSHAFYVRAVETVIALTTAFDRETSALEAAGQPGGARPAR